MTGRDYDDRPLSLWACTCGQTACASPGERHGCCDTAEWVASIDRAARRSARRPVLVHIALACVVGALLGLTLASTAVAVSEVDLDRSVEVAVRPATDAEVAAVESPGPGRSVAATPSPRCQWKATAGTVIARIPPNMMKITNRFSGCTNWVWVKARIYRHCDDGEWFNGRDCPNHDGGGGSW